MDFPGTKIIRRQQQDSARGLAAGVAAEIRLPQEKPQVPATFASVSRKSSC
jgi:hypothetical protein